MNMLQTVSIWISLILALLAPWSQVAARADHNQFPFVVYDYNDCTDEEVFWDAVIYEVIVDKVTPSGQGLFVDNWRWEATIEGLTSGYIWESRGVAPFVQTYSLDNSLTGGLLAIEKSILKPQSPGAPRILLDAYVRLQYNANGELVVNSAHYTYSCLGN